MLQLPKSGGELHFDSAAKEGKSATSVHLDGPALASCAENTVQMWRSLVSHYNVPAEDRFGLFCAVRTARAFADLTQRRVLTRIRMHAHMVLGRCKRCCCAMRSR